MQIMRERERDVKMEGTTKLLDEITVENVKRQIADGWTNSFFVAEHIIGYAIWECLSDWDRKIITARIHRVIRENKLL